MVYLPTYYNKNKLTVGQYTIHRSYGIGTAKILDFQVNGSNRSETFGRRNPKPLLRQLYLWAGLESPMLSGWNTTHYSCWLIKLYGTCKTSSLELVMTSFSQNFWTLVALDLKWPHWMPIAIRTKSWIQKNVPFNESPCYQLGSQENNRLRALNAVDVFKNLKISRFPIILTCMNMIPIYVSKGVFNAMWWDIALFIGRQLLAQIRPHDLE